MKYSIPSNRYFLVGLLLFGFSRSGNAININIDDKVIRDLGSKLHEAIPLMGTELRKTVPLLGQQFKEITPEVEKSVKSVCEALLKTVTLLINPFKIAPLIGLGFAGALIGLLLLKKGIESYIEGYTERTLRKKGFVYLLASAALLGVGITTIIKSDSILAYMTN